MKLNKSISKCFISVFYEDYIKNLRHHSSFQLERKAPVSIFYHYSGNFRIELKKATRDTRYMKMKIVYCPVILDSDFNVKQSLFLVGYLLNVPNTPILRHK